MFAVACECGVGDSEGGCSYPLDPDGGPTWGWGGSGYGGSLGTGGVGGPSSDAPDPGCPPYQHAERRKEGNFCTPIACVVGFENCNSTWGDGCEVAIGSNAANCGACDNACSAGSCLWGSCFELTQIAGTPGAEVIAMFATGTALYYLVDHPADPSPNLHVLAGGSDVELISFGFAERTPEIAFTSDRVVVLAHEDRWLGTFGDSGIQTLVSKLSGQPHALVAGGGFAYVAYDTTLALDASIDGGDSGDADAEVPATLGSVLRVDVATGSSALILESATSIRALAIHELTQRLFVASTDPGSILALDLATATTTEIATGPFEPVRLATDGLHVYATDALGWSVLRVLATGGPLEVVTTSPIEPFDVRIHAGEVWFTTAKPARLYASHPSGDVLLAGMLRPRTPVAVDVDFVYWSAPKIGVLALER